MFQTQMLAICNCGSELGRQDGKGVVANCLSSVSWAPHVNELARVPAAAMPYLCCERRKVLGLRQVASQQQSHTVPCAHTSCSRATSAIRLSPCLERKVSSSPGPAYRQITSCSLQVIWATKTGICYLEVKGDINIYKWLSCNCKCATCVCVWAQASINTHVSYTYRMFGTFSGTVSVHLCTLMLIIWKMCGSYFKTLWNLWKHKGTCLTSETETRHLPWTRFI